MRLVTKLQRFVISLVLCLFSQALYCQASLAESLSRYNMPEGATRISKEIYGLHMFAFWVCVGIAVVVFGVLFYSIIMHRKSRGVQPAQFHEHTGVEITWAVIPFLLLVAMAIPATKVLMKLDDTRNAAINLKITGYQWKWKYDYLDQGISFFSNLSTPIDEIHNKVEKNPNYLLEVDNPVVLPIHKKIRLIATANDVIHSWWVSELGVKIDAIPGFIHETWIEIEKPGVYRGVCAELCGINHAYMPIVVIAKTQEEFDKWVSEKTQGKIKSTNSSAEPVKRAQLTKNELVKRGKTVHDVHCAVCHKADGAGMPPAFPAITGSKVATGNIKSHIDIIVNGKRGTAMQAFGPQLTDEDIAAVVTYQRNALGNHVGDVAQVKDVAATRGK